MAGACDRRGRKTTDCYTHLVLFRYKQWCHQAGEARWAATTLSTTPAHDLAKSFKARKFRAQTRRCPWQPWMQGCGKTRIDSSQELRSSDCIHCAFIVDPKYQGYFQFVCSRYRRPRIRATFILGMAAGNHRDAHIQDLVPVQDILQSICDSFARDIEHSWHWIHDTWASTVRLLTKLNIYIIFSYYWTEHL